MGRNNITLSVVSHGQSQLIGKLLISAERLVHSIDSINLIYNIPDISVAVPGNLKSIVTEGKNNHVKGFGENHNACFSISNSEFFCVCNPDIQFIEDPFPKILECFRDPAVGVVIPRALNSNGQVEDNVRKFPTIFRLLKKLLRIKPSPEIRNIAEPFSIECGAGLFMVFRSKAFQDVGGFDEGYFLYYEDFDICTRLWKKKWKVIHDPRVTVIHDAQRTSHRNVKYLKWHLSSIVRYFMKHSFSFRKLTT